MKLYLAGNFPIMGDVEKETEFQTIIKRDKGVCYRLGSFYYRNYLDNLLEVKDAENGKSKKKTESKKERKILKRIEKPKRRVRLRKRKHS